MDSSEHMQHTPFGAGARPTGTSTLMGAQGSPKGIEGVRERLRQGGVEMPHLQLPAQAPSPASSPTRSPSSEAWKRRPFTTMRLRAFAEKLERLPDECDEAATAGSKEAAALMHQLADVRAQVSRAEKSLQMAQYGSPAPPPSSTPASPRRQGGSPASPRAGSSPRRASPPTIQTGGREEARMVKDAMDALSRDVAVGGAHGRVARGIDMMEALAKEMSGQVASHCSELGEAAAKASSWLAEVARAGLSERGKRQEAIALSEAGRRDMEAAKAIAERQADKDRDRAESAERDAAEATARARELEVQFAGEQERTQAEVKRVQWELRTEQERADILEGRLREAERDRLLAKESCRAEFQDALASCQKERDSLAERVRFLELQLGKARQSSPAPQVDQSSQTLLANTDASDAPVVTAEGRAGEGAHTLQEGGKVKSSEWARRVAAAAYMERTNSQRGDRRLLSDLVQDWLIGHYGLSTSAHAHFENLRTTVRAHAESDFLLRIFGQLIGAVAGPEERKTEEVVDFHIECLKRVAPDGENLEDHFQAHQEGVSALVTPAAVIEAARELFAHVKRLPGRAAGLLERAREHADPSTGGVPTGWACEVLLQEWEAEHVYCYARLRTMHRAADDSDSGLVGFDAFHEAAVASHTADPDRAAARAYHDAAKGVDANLVGADEFARACFANGIRPGLPPGASASTKGTEEKGKEKAMPPLDPGLSALEEAMRDTGRLCGDSALVGASLEECMERVRQEAFASRHPPPYVDRALRLEQRLRHLAGTRRDSGAAWEAFRLLMASLCRALPCNKALPAASFL